jgi:hypothetical protein
MMRQGTGAAYEPGQTSAIAAHKPWSLADDIRWGAINAERARAQGALLRSVRRAAIATAVRPVHVSALLQAVTADVHAAAVCSLDLYDGLKHFHALRVYLESVEHRPAITDGELAAARQEAAGAIATMRAVEPLRGMVEFLLNQHLAAHNLRRLGARSEEPVLAVLLELTAADELRHARCMSDVLRARVRADGDAAPRIKAEAERLRDTPERRRAGATEEEAVDDLAYRSFAREINAMAPIAPAEVLP